jgi:hypothetical protein
LAIELTAEVYVVARGAASQGDHTAIHREGAARPRGPLPRSRFNCAGHGWTARTTVTGTLATPSFSPRVRLADIDGSSTTDLIWGNAYAWEYLDFSGGRRPRLPVGVHNGLGAETTIDYGSAKASIRGTARGEREK